MKGFEMLIPPKNYFDKSIFEIEIEDIFRKKWLFACLVDDIPNANDYYILNIGKHSIILYNTGKEFVALQNVCPHRFNRIFIDQKGNAPLVCPFHSWKFNIKEASQIKENTNQLSSSKPTLKRYAICLIGKFIFFHFEEKPIESLLSQLNGLEEELHLVSEIIGNKIHEDLIPHNANWKIICENVIDRTHCTSLHKDTLVKIGYCVRPADEAVRYGDNSKFILPPVMDKARELRDKFLNKNLPRKIQDNLYKHTLYFPNFTIGIYEGLNITIGNIIPKSATETDYRLLYYTSKINNQSKFTENLLNSMKIDTIEFGSQVFNEDKVILEQVQKGVLEAEHNGFVFESELRLKWFFETYNKYIH